MVRKKPAKSAVLHRHKRPLLAAAAIAAAAVILAAFSFFSAGATGALPTELEITSLGYGVAGSSTESSYGTYPGVYRIFALDNGGMIYAYAINAGSNETAMALYESIRQKINDTAASQSAGVSIAAWRPLGSGSIYSRYAGAAQVNFVNGGFVAAIRLLPDQENDSVIYAVGKIMESRMP